MVILSVIFVFFARINSTIPFVGKDTLDTSILYASVKDIVPTIFPSIIREIDSIITQDKNLLNPINW